MIAQLSAKINNFGEQIENLGNYRRQSEDYGIQSMSCKKWGEIMKQGIVGWEISVLNFLMWIILILFMINKECLMLKFFISEGVVIQCAWGWRVEKDAFNQGIQEVLQANQFKQQCQPP